MAEAWRIGEDVIFHELKRRNRNINNADIKEAIKRCPIVVDVLEEQLLDDDDPNYCRQKHKLKMVEIKLRQEIENMEKDRENDNANTTAMDLVHKMFEEAEDENDNNSSIREFLKTLFMSYKNAENAEKNEKVVKFVDELKRLFPELNKILGYVEVRLTHKLVQHEIDYLPCKGCNGCNGCNGCKSPDDMMVELSKNTKKTSKYIILNEPLDESYEGAVRVVCWILHSMCEAFGKHEQPEQPEQPEQWDTFYTEFTYCETSNYDYEDSLLSCYDIKVNSRMTSSTVYTTINAEYITYDRIRNDEFSNFPVEYKASLCVQNGKIVLLIDVVS
jgi:hypothetical protein